MNRSSPRRRLCSATKDLPRSSGPTFRLQIGTFRPRRWILMLCPPQRDMGVFDAEDLEHCVFCFWFRKSKGLDPNSQLWRNHSHLQTSRRPTSSHRWSSLLFFTFTITQPNNGIVAFDLRHPQMWSDNGRESTSIFEANIFSACNPRHRALAWFSAIAGDQRPATMQMSLKPWQGDERPCHWWGHLCTWLSSPRCHLPQQFKSFPLQQ